MHRIVTGAKPHHVARTAWAPVVLGAAIALLVLAGRLGRARYLPLPGPSPLHPRRRFPCLAIAHSAAQ